MPLAYGAYIAIAMGNIVFVGRVFFCNGDNHGGLGGQAQLMEIECYFVAPLAIWGLISGHYFFDVVDGYVGFFLIGD